MKCNMGKTDRVLRAVVGLVIILLGIYNSYFICLLCNHLEIYQNSEE